jgi:UrcA family protein
MIARILALSVMSAAATLTQANGTLAASDEVPTVRVHYQDLDLSTEQGATTLYKRIAGAAKQVCPSTNTMSVNARSFAEKCVAAAIERAVADVNSPQLARLSALRSRRQG